MRMLHPDGTTVHIAYCTNVHPAEDLAGVLSQLDRYAEPVRRRLDADLLGLGLWLAEPVAAGLAADPAARRQLRHELDVRGLEVVTLNGFPYKAFQAPVVKYDVYYPDWTDPRRLAYTLDLAAVLIDLMPDDAVRGSISTLPLAWREPWGPAEVTAAREQTDLLATSLARQARDHGRPVRVAFEPEPGCVVETTWQAIKALSHVDREYLGVCVDLAHLACAWEDPAEAIASYADAGLPVVKCQVSAALEVADPAGTVAALTDYVEPRFLHQTRSADGRSYDDLPEALIEAEKARRPWRVHFHVPLHAPAVPPLRSTIPVLRAGLRALIGGSTAQTDHLEVETYTWGVLPADQRPHDDASLVRGIAAELAFTRSELIALGLADAAKANVAKDTAPRKVT